MVEFEVSCKLNVLLSQSLPRLLLLQVLKVLVIYYC